MEESKIICRLSTVSGVSAPGPVLLKGQMYSNKQLFSKVWDAFTSENYSVRNYSIYQGTEYNTTNLLKPKPVSSELFHLKALKREHLLDCKYYPPSIIRLYSYPDDNGNNQNKLNKKKKGECRFTLSQKKKSKVTVIKSQTCFYTMCRKYSL